MSEMIDRARIAVAEVIQSSNLPVGSYVDSEKIVRAVLEAIREPTMEISEMSYCSDFAENLWPAMIDAALS